MKRAVKEISDLFGFPEHLVPGTVYTVQVRAIGGSTSNSDWTPTSHMAMHAQELVL